MYNFLMENRIIYGLYLIIWIIVPNAIQTILSPILYALCYILVEKDSKYISKLAAKYSWMAKIGNITGDENFLQYLKKVWIFLWKYYITSSNFEELYEKFGNEL